MKRINQLFVLAEEMEKKLLESPINVEPQIYNPSEGESPLVIEPTNKLNLSPNIIDTISKQLQNMHPSVKKISQIISSNSEQVGQRPNTSEYDLYVTLAELVSKYNYALAQLRSSSKKKQ
jgi:hypothetical protein